MLHDEHRDVDDVVAFLRRWLMVDDARARVDAGGSLSSPLWRAYTSTTTSRATGCCAAGSTNDQPDQSLTAWFGRLLDEPLIPSTL